MRGGARESMKQSVCASQRARMQRERERELERGGERKHETESLCEPEGNNAKGREKKT